MAGRVQNDIEGSVLAWGLGMDDDKGVLLWIRVTPFLFNSMTVGFNFVLRDRSKHLGRCLIADRFPIRAKGEEWNACKKEGNE